MINNSTSKRISEASIGYWASQEQYSMQQLIRFIKEAEKGGIITTMTSDHFHPWRHDDGYGNFTWIWIAAAVERTKKDVICNRSYGCCFTRAFQVLLHFSV